MLTIRIQRVYVKGKSLLKDLYEVAPYYTTCEHIVTNQGILIEQDEVKYLGIIFDNTLKFTTHINNITQKIGKVVGVLWKGRSLPLSIKLKIYYSLIHSQLNFAILVWESIISKNINGSTEFERVPKQLKNVNAVHNKAVRASVCARKRDPLSKIFRELRLLKLIDIYYYNLGIFAYQTFTSGCPHFFDTMLYPIINMHDALHAQLKILRLILHLILYFIISLICKNSSIYQILSCIFVE